MLINADFKAELERAQSGDELAVERIFQEFEPLVRKYQYIDGIPDTDLLSELQLAAFLCIKRFRIDEEDMRAFILEAENLLYGDE